MGALIPCSGRPGGRRLMKQEAAGGLPFPRQTRRAKIRHGTQTLPF